MKLTVLTGKQTKMLYCSRKGSFTFLHFTGFIFLFLSLTALYEKIRNKGKRIIILLGHAFILSHFIAVQAQEGKYLFSNIDKTKGLSHNHVISFLKDSKGFMWVGTMDGLCRFDGYSFKVYKSNPADSCSLKDNIIYSLFEDYDHKIWITAGNYFMMYDPETECFTNRQSLFHGRIPIPYGSRWFHVYDKNRDILYANTISGIYKYIAQLDSVVPIPFMGIDTGRVITYVETDKKGNIWFACKNSRLYEMNGITYEIVDSLELPKKFDNSYRFFVDAQNDLWIFDNNNATGLIYYNTKSGKSRRLLTGSSIGRLSSDLISFVNQDEEGYLWVGTDHGGINIVNKTDFSVRVVTNDPLNKQSLCDNSITNIYMDPQGFIWMGSFKRGLSYYHKNLFVFDLQEVKLSDSKSDGYNDIDNFVEDRNGNIWIGTNGGGLLYYDRSKNTYKQYIHDPANPSSISANIIIGLYCDSKNRLWIGTYLGGLNLRDGNKFLHFKNNPSDPASLTDDRVWDICEDSDGRLWIGTLLGGVNVFDPEKKKVIECYRSLEGTTIRSNVVFSVIPGRNNTMWFATVDGIRSFNRTTGKFSYYSHDENDPRSLSRNLVLDIFEDSRGFIWAATSDGLNRLDQATGKFDIFRQDEGLPSNLIMAIVEDNDHNLWMSTSKGVSKLTITQDPDSDSLRYAFDNFDELDGLQGKEFNEKAIMRTRGGELFFGGPKGFNIIDPKKTAPRNIESDIVFTDFLIFNKSIDNKKSYDGRSLLKKSMPYTSEIRLKHNENVFTIEFSNLNFIHPERRKYMYRMDNFKDEWFTVDSRERRVTYTNLNPGEYLFRVRSTNNDGTWNEQEAQLAIVIRPPWWNTLLFKIFSILFIASAVIGYYYFRLRQLNRQKKQLEMKVKERTNELSYTNNQLQERQKQVTEQNLELEKHRNNLERLVRDRTVELEGALRKAKESDRLKSAFLANVSHEIRTPMNAIVGFSSLLDDPENTSEEQDDYIDMIHSNSESLLMLINDILDLSLIEANQLVIKVESFRLNNLVDQIVSFYKMKYENSGFEIRVNHTLMDDDLVLMSDRLRVKQILSNFMSNACKFTISGTVEFGTSWKNNRLNLYVRDTGIGISKEDMQYLFKRFRKLGEEFSTTARGVGLGLAISKRLADLLGGTIEVQSEPGKGSVFTFSIPYTPEVDMVVLLKEPLKKSAGKDWSDKKILIVEDEEDNYLYLKRVIEKTRATVTWAENGIKAVQLVESGRHFDLILMDIKMPGMDGTEALKLLKEKDPGLLIIAQTAYAQREDEMIFRQKGFDDYIAKPIKLDDLIRIFEKHL